MKLLAIIRSADNSFKRNLALFLVSYFFVLFNYPMVRASSTTFFFEAFGARSSPLAWLWAVLFLSLSIFVSNLLQKRFSVQKVFLIVSTFTSVLFLGSTIGLLGGEKGLSFWPFIWKEIYIVMQIHLLLAYANNYIRKEDFKAVIGPVGAVGSIGGIMGGELTNHLASTAGTPTVMVLGIFCIFMPSVFFYFTEEIKTEKGPKVHAPMATLTPDVRKYVGCIALIVALTQFIINIADFNFHVVFEAVVSDASARTSYLGRVYTYTNLVTLILQFLVLPVLLTRVSERNYHLFIPLSYLLFLLVLIASNATGLFPLVLYFIYLKGSDYSLFSAGKEVLYQPLLGPQKYGAKYLTDMLVYRVSKALIAAVLIYVQTSTILNMMMIFFLAMWVVLVIKLFHLHRQIFN